MMGCLLLASALFESFLHPQAESRPWTYWFWSNTLTDATTVREELADIASLGFGGVLITDSRGYWDDEEHVVNPPATMRWGSAEWLDLMTVVLREAARNNVKVMMNIAASGGTLRGDEPVGADAPKALFCCETTPHAPAPAEPTPHFREIAAFAVRTEGRARAPYGWKPAGDGVFSMAASQGTREDGEGAFVRKVAREVRRLAPGTAVPDGADWSVVRFGSGVLTNRMVEIDVLDPHAVRRHLERVIGKLVARAPELIGRTKTLAALYNVSWEGSMPTWSPAFAADFRRLRGYDIMDRLPILAGYDLADVSTAAFMRDFRRSRGEIMTEALYGTVRAWAHQWGMESCSESGGPWQRNPEVFGEADQMAFLAANDIPQGEFWPCVEKNLDPSCGHANRNGRFLTKGIVSAAHVYGARCASVEAFTHMHRHWSVDPAFLKPLIDQCFADGINRCVWHTYTTAPRKYGTPGIEYFAGSHINRNVTWHDDLPPFIAYLHRIQEVLQRGTPVTDIAVLGGSRPYTNWGEEKNNRFRNRVSEETELNVTVPRGYAYDLINDAALKNVPDLLARYRVVYDARKPENNGREVPVGGLLPDVETASDFTWCHRRVDGHEVYFIAGEGAAELVFRAAAPSVEIWNPLRVTRTAADATRLADGRTKVRLELPVGGSCLVVFAPQACALAAPRERTTALELAGPWKVDFAYHKWISATPPCSVVLEKLVDFTTRDDLKYFSGTAIYRTSCEWKGTTGESVALAIGELPSGLARVVVNGKDCGVVWCAPWEAEIGASLRPGANEIEIRYTNNWYNRLVGDCRLDPENRVTKSVLRYWQVPRVGGGPKDFWSIRPTVYSGYSSYDPLQSSGLLGPIRLLTDR